MGVEEWNYLSSFVCVYFLFLGFQYACTSIYFYWKALLFQKLQLCKYYDLSLEEWLKAIAIYFNEKKMEYFRTWSFGVFGKWRDQSAQLRSNLLFYIKLKFFYVVFFLNHLKLCAIGILVKTHFLKDLNLALMHVYIRTHTCELSWSQFICCH